MPLQITRPAIPEERVAQNLESRAQEFVNDCADLARGALQSYTPNHWKQWLYKAVSNVGSIPGGVGVGGPVGRGAPLPYPLMPAPKGVIAQFLMQYPEYAVRNRDYDSAAPVYIPKGKSFPKAWQHLPSEAKLKLKEERLAGRFGGTPEDAPYWIIAEAGLAHTAVPPRHYLRNSQMAVERAVPMVEARTLRTL